MNNQELMEMLNSIERLKSNISECDSIIRVLREIQKNYETAVAKPTELLEKLSELTKNMELNHSDLCSKSTLILDTINKTIEDYLNNDREMHSQLIAQCQEQIKELVEIKNTLQDSVNETKEEIRLMVKTTTNTKKFVLVSLGLGVFSTIITIVLLILNII